MYDPKGALEAAVGLKLREWARPYFEKYTTETKALEALAKRSLIGKETLRQVMNGQQAAKITTLQAIVSTLGFTLTELFSSIETRKNLPKDPTAAHLRRVSGV